MSTGGASGQRQSANAASNLVKLLDTGETIAAPGVFAPIAALLASQAGAKVLYFSGAGFSNLMGMPDLGVFTLTELATAVSQITSVVNEPIIVDVDTGFGSTINVERTVKVMVRAGAAAIHLEDQILPKRCGHLDGKQLVSVEEMMQKIVAAKDAGAGHLQIIARTDARGVDGLAAAIERGQAYCEAGADLIFPDALESAEEFGAFAKNVRAPLLANMTEFGKTPYLPLSKFQEMGYRLVIFPVTAFRMVLRALDTTYREILTRGSQQSLLASMMTRQELYDRIRYSDYERADERIASQVRKLLGRPKK